MSVRVLLADRELIIREGVRILLEREGVNVVGEAADIDQAVSLVAALQPQVVVLEQILVRNFNDLPPRADNGGFGMPEVSTHLHNGHTPSESDDDATATERSC